MQKISITLPHVDNDGNPLNHTTIKNQLLDLTGGYSEFQVSGVWRDPASGLIYHDHSTVVYTVCDPGIADVVEHVYVPAWAAQLRQVCLLVERTTVSIAFVEPVKEHVA